MKTEDKLHFRAKVLHDSIEWWKTEMAYWVHQSDKFEDNLDDPDYEDAMSEISNAMRYLILKGEWENHELADLQEDIAKYEISKAFKSKTMNSPEPPKKTLKNLKMKKKNEKK
jgi:hypothetical protein|tara:strand:+ start:405 stop:743 length:339 start_codon:yes stop_codon:yes gene_type:complete